MLKDHGLKDVAMEAGKVCVRQAEWSGLIAAVRTGGNDVAYGWKTFAVTTDVKHSGWESSNKKNSGGWQYHILHNIRSCNPTVRKHSISMSFPLQVAWRMLLFWPQSSVKNRVAAQIWRSADISQSKLHKHWTRNNSQVTATHLCRNCNKRLIRQ